MINRYNILSGTKYFIENGSLDYFNNPKFRVDIFWKLFKNKNYLKADKVSFIPNKITNLQIAFEIKPWLFYVDNGFTSINF